MSLLIALLVFMVTAASAPAEHARVAQSAKPQSVFIGVGPMMPRVTRQTVPPYPAGATPDGAVDLEVVVDTKGAVTHARVAQSPDASGAIDRACIDALGDWRLKPAVDENGRLAATLVRARFEFAKPTTAGQPGTVSARLAELPQAPPPNWDALGSLVIHDSKEPGFTWPKVIREVKPRYTRDGLRSMVQGAVEMRIVVLADGTVGAARVTKSLQSGLDRAALIAARYWYFEPAKMDGKAVAADVGLDLEFRLH